MSYSYYKAHYIILKKSPKYQLYLAHFNNLPVYDIDFATKKQSEDITNFYLTSGTIEDLTDALLWIEDNLGLEPHKIEWIENDK
jgi:hypothetical protein